MKHIIKVLIIITVFSCKAQNIISIYEVPDDIPTNPYYKDIDNDFNPFIGTWKWESGLTSWTIEFQKIEMFHHQHTKYDSSGISHEYNDYLIGEYQYIENGEELIKSLPTSLGDSPYDSNIYSASITTLNRGFPPCDECALNTKYIIAIIKDPTRLGLQGKMRMAHFIENGIKKIRMRILNYDNLITESNYSGQLELTIPEGIYTFIKQ